MLAVYWIFQSWSPQRVDKYFRKLQLLSAAAYSFGHGTNDAQKTMGIVAGTLFTAGILKRFYIPFWVVLMAHAAIGLGTMAGGWRIVKTMGMKITRLKPVGGFCAETAAAISLLGTAMAGIPVSTTHTIAGGIMGVGSVQRFSAVHWGVARSIMWAWVLTIPISGAVSYVVFLYSPILPRSVNKKSEVRGQGATRGEVAAGLSCDVPWPSRSKASGQDLGMPVARRGGIMRPLLVSLNFRLRSTHHSLPTFAF